MFEPNSRYASLEIKTLTITDPDGQARQVRYVERRFINLPAHAPTLVEHVVAQGERLDQITAKHLGDPTQFWRVADANDALRPEELTDLPGRRIRITLPH